MFALTITLAYHCHKLNLVLHHKTIIIALRYIIILRPDNGMNSSSTRFTRFWNNGEGAQGIYTHQSNIMFCTSH